MLEDSRARSYWYPTVFINPAVPGRKPQVVLPCTVSISSNDSKTVMPYAASARLACRDWGRRLAANAESVECFRLCQVSVHSALHFMFAIHAMLWSLALSRWALEFGRQMHHARADDE